MKKEITAKGISKVIGYNKIYLHKTWDLRHGYGYHSQVIDYKYHYIGDGFHKHNKFTAVRLAITDAEMKKYRHTAH